MLVNFHPPSRQKSRQESKDSLGALNTFTFDAMLVNFHPPSRQKSRQESKDSLGVLSTEAKKKNRQKNNKLLRKEKQNTLGIEGIDVCGLKK